MADKGGKSEFGDLESIFKLARNKPMNVALVIGKEGLAMTGDARKSADVMWREAKAQAGGGSKGGMGVCNVVGKEVQIQFTDEYPATLKKAFKDMLRAQGLKFKPVFIGADGTVDGDEEGDEEGLGEEGPMVAEAEPEPGADEGEDDPEAKLREVLLAEFEGFKDALAEAKSASPAPAVKKLGGLEQMFLTEVERSPKKAGAVLALLRKTAEAFAPAGGAVDDGAAAERQAGLASLEKSVDALLAEFA